MADFLKGFALGGEKGWEIGSAMAAKKGDRERRKEDQREALRLELLKKGYVDSPTKIESMSLEDLSMAIALQDEKNRKKAERRKREYDQEVLDDAREFERHALEGKRDWQLFQKDEDRAYDAAQEIKKARTEVAGYDDKIREQVSQAPSLIRSDAPSLPVPEEFQGSKLEDITRSLKEEKGEVDWLAARARGARIQAMADKAKEDARANQEARDRAIFSESISAIGTSQRSAGEKGVEFVPVNPKESGVPIWLQKTNHEYGRNIGSIKGEDNDREFLAKANMGLLTSSKGLGEWGYRFRKAITVDEVNEEQAKQSIAGDKKKLFEVQQQVYGTPPNLTPMGKPEILDLTAGEVNNLTRKWNEAFEAQRIKTIGAEAKAKSDATTLTPEQEVEREDRIKKLRMQQNLPEFTPALHYGAPTDKFGTPLEGQDKVVKGYYPNFAPYIAKTGKYPTQDQIYAATRIMESQGLHVIQKVPKGWVDPREAPHIREPMRQPAIPDGVAPPSNLPPLEESAQRGVDIGDLAPEIQKAALTYPERVPFKTPAGVWVVREGNKLYPARKPE